VVTSRTPLHYWVSRLGAVEHWMAGKREPSGPTRRLLYLLENGKNISAVERLRRYRE
jgi:hypothetical protein